MKVKSTRLNATTVLTDVDFEFAYCKVKLGTNSDGELNVIFSSRRVVLKDFEIAQLCAGFQLVFNQLQINTKD